jgi:hypothetical protein
MATSSNPLTSPSTVLFLYFLEWSGGYGYQLTTSKRFRLDLGGRQSQYLETKFRQLEIGLQLWNFGYYPGREKNNEQRRESLEWIQSTLSTQSPPWTQSAQSDKGHQYTSVHSSPIYLLRDSVDSANSITSATSTSSINSTHCSMITSQLSFLGNFQYIWSFFYQRYLS